MSKPRSKRGKDAAQDQPKQASAPENLGYAARYVTVRLSPQEAARLKHFTARFQEQVARLSDGKPLQTAEDCVRYIIQRSSMGGDSSE